MNALILPIIRNWLADITPDIWTEAEIEKELRANCKDSGIDFPYSCKLLRFALLGVENSPSIFLVMYALGKEETLKRIRPYLSVGERYMSENIIDWRNVYEVGLPGLTVIKLGEGN